MDPVNFENFSYNELKNLCRERQLSLKGRKGDLLARLQADEAEREAEAGPQGDVVAIGGARCRSLWVP